jgi:hypothetical protein
MRKSGGAMLMEGPSMRGKSVNRAGGYSEFIPNR